MSVYAKVKVGVRRLLLGGGVALFLLFALCWSPYPWRMYYWLSMPEAVLDVEPEWIVVLGGGGIPSESGLIRTYYGALAAERFPGARVIVALPEYGDSEDSSLRRMRNELIMRGVDAGRIILEPKGSNTRAQAVEVARMVDLESALLVVTSPEHMRRSVLSFRRAGFVQVGADAALDTSADGDMSLSAESIDDKLLAPAVEGSLVLRYHFWNHLGYLNRVAREFTALTYYKVKGWI